MDFGSRKQEVNLQLHVDISVGSRAELPVDRKHKKRPQLLVGRDRSWVEFGGSDIASTPPERRSRHRRRNLAAPRPSNKTRFIAAPSTKYLRAGISPHVPYTYTITSYVFGNAVLHKLLELHSGALYTQSSLTQL